MNSISSTSPLPDSGLLEAALGGDENAFGRLIEPHRRELHAHCYRMLASLHDAEDALQDALLRAWRGLKGLTDQTALRAWLYRIATNTCLDVIGKRPKRVIPIDYGPASDPVDGPGLPVVESVWIEPYPDETLAVEDGFASPDAQVEEREAVELAFIAALQHLPANQRAALILREVLGFSAKEVAETLDTSVASVNSALQRARKTIDDKLPEQSQQKNNRQLEDSELREIVDNYMDAMRRDDIDKVVSMLAEDAAWSMPPLATWYGGGLDVIRGFLEVGPLNGNIKWAHRQTMSNGQPAVGAYTWDDEENAYIPFALDVISLEGTKIKEICSFIVRDADVPEDYDFVNYPERPVDPRQVRDVFERAGLPTRLDAE